MRRAGRAARSVRTIAQAPSEDGQVSEYRIGSQSIGEAWTFSRVMSCSWRCAYGFFRALRRSLYATSEPTASGAPVRRMYARTCGAKKPPAPASSGCWKGTGSESPHMALDSDCFSKARVRTVRWTRAATRLAATRAVDPPTDPAVWTRSIGLPTAPRASAR